MSSDEGTDGYGRAGLLAATVALGILSYIATCGTASAEPARVRYRNEDRAAAVAALRVCQSGTCVEVPASCAPAATCEAVADLRPGMHPTTLHAATAIGGPWSEASPVVALFAPISAADCLALDGCRFDTDRDGVVTNIDFGRFLGVFGRPW